MLHLAIPPVMYLDFAALLIIWSIACMLKLNVINSQIGFNPPKAAPTAKPAKPLSVIGVSMILLSPYLSNKPLVTLYAPWYFATSSPSKNTSSSLPSSSSSAKFNACLTVKE
eukprot:NODE_409_length_9212_cov_0.585537.p12 type:complete len:112 gc:universal NODE_409_length_9212_cov_0.585537:599-264(-)